MMFGSLHWPNAASSSIYLCTCLNTGGDVAIMVRAAVYSACTGDCNKLALAYRSWWLLGHCCSQSPCIHILGISGIALGRSLCGLGIIGGLLGILNVGHSAY